MKVSLGIVILMLLSFTSGHSDIVIKFESRAYLYSQVRDKIEHDTPYDIELPFVDEARVKKFLPEQLSFNECLDWIIEYFEIENKLTLNFKIHEQQIIFQKASLLSDEEQEKILSLPLTLEGQNWSILDAIEAAKTQTKLDISLPFKDEKDLKAHYFYHCSLGEFLEEVRNYWLQQMGYRIHTILESNRITFFKGRSNIQLQSVENLSAPLHVLPEKPQTGALP